MVKFKANYDLENDIIYLYSPSKKVKESVEFSEDIVLDFDGDGRIVGIEIFYASEFFGVLNRGVNKGALNGLEEAEIEYKDYRNMWFVHILFNIKGEIISQRLPPLRKSEYASPLIASA